MRQPIYDDPDWTLDIDSACSREETWDGFTVFKKPGLTVFAVVYCGQPFDAEHVVRNLITSGKLHADAEVSFEALDQNLAGAVLVDRRRKATRLTGAASSYGHVAQVSCDFQDDAFLPEAIAVWRSLRHKPPEYARLCGEADPPLADLLAKLEGELHLRHAVAEVRRRGQLVEAVAVLIAALADDRHIVRRNACEAFGLLEECTPAILEALRACLADPSGEIGAWAGEALLDLGEPPEVVARAMIELLTRPERPPIAGEPSRRHAGRVPLPERYHASRILTYVGEAARPYHEIIRRFQRDEDPQLRLRIAEILLSLGDPPEGVTRPVYEAADDTSLELFVRSRVVDWLFENAEPNPKTSERLRAIQAAYRSERERDAVAEHGSDTTSDEPPAV